jgi:hypothetical protein
MALKLRLPANSQSGASRAIDHATGETGLMPTKRIEIEQPVIPAPEL